MTDAEKKWDKWDDKFQERTLSATGNHIGLGQSTACKASREAYKEALRSAIEKQIEQVKKVIAETPAGWPSVKLIAETALKILTEQLERIDQVTPKE